MKTTLYGAAEQLSRNRGAVCAFELTGFGALSGPTAVKSGDRTVGLLITLKAANPDHLATVLARAASLAKGRDPAEDKAALADMGIDPMDWSVEAVRALKTSHR